MSQLSITSFQANGRTHSARADEQRIHCTLYVEGPAHTMRFKLTQKGSVCWESGDLPWKGHFSLELPLKPRANYTLSAVVEGPECLAESAVELMTGMMGEVWKAGWIEPVQAPGIKERPIQFFEQFVPMPDHFGGHDRLRPVQELRRVFNLEELPQRAALYASAHGVYTLWLNGNRVDSRRLAPETTPYETMLYYQIYELTDLLQVGENTLTVLLGDGWWIGRIGLTGDSCQYGDRLGFLGQLELDYEGYSETIITNESFEAKPSFISYSDLMMGEKWDLNAVPEKWMPCVPIGEAGEGLTLQTVEPVTVLHELEPAALFIAPNGELLADFGQCLAGVVKLRVNCPAGREITLDHSETLDTGGNFFRNILGRNKDQQDKVVCGAGETEFCPEFTYHGFRYVRLTGVTQEEVLSVSALMIGTPLEQQGLFSCSHSGLEQLQGNICRSARSNMVSVPTDCPQREKVGWTGDIQVFAPTGCFNYDLHGFLSAWLAQMRQIQTEDGGVPIVVPSYPEQTKMQSTTFGGNTSAAWSDACVLLPLAIYKATGDGEVLRDNLAMMEQWMGFISNASHDYIWSEGYHFGDWLIPSFQNDVNGGTAATAPVIAACQYAITTRAYIEVLEAVGASEEQIKAYRDLLSKIKTAVREKFIHKDGTVEGGLQGLYVMALYSDVAENELAAKVAAKLDTLIEANGGGLDTGFVSTPHLLGVLMANGYEKRAWELLYRTESPSWLYQVEQGATSIWENWNAIRPNGEVTTSSFNHYSLGAVGDWIYQNIGGLRPKQAGWKSICYAPNIDCGLEWARCSHQTPYGVAACSWKRTQKGTQVEVTVPYGVDAVLCLPGLEQPLTAGVHCFEI